jgi:hypothetical protein
MSMFGLFLGLNGRRVAIGIQKAMTMVIVLNGSGKDDRFGETPRETLKSMI